MEMHPSQFEVNEAWIVFQLTKKPVVTERDGPVHCFGLMDAASCFLLCAEFFPGTGIVALSKKNIQGLLKKGWKHKKKYPSKLFVVQGLLNGEIEAEAQGLGIAVTGVAERQLLVIIGEAQGGFQSQFS